MRATEGIEMSPRAVIGENVKRMRTSVGATMDLLAAVARRNGLKWDTSRVSALESGMKPISVDELLVLRSVMSEVVSEPISLASFFEGTGVIRLPAYGYDRALVRKMFADSPIREAGEFHGVDDGLGESDIRAARSLGLTVDAVNRMSNRLWGRSFTMERDSRSGDNVSSYRRGHVARVMIAELETEIGE